MAPKVSLLLMLVRYPLVTGRAHPCKSMQDVGAADDVSTSLGKRPHAAISPRMPQKKKGDTLAVLLQAMVGKQVMVELKNDTEVRGFIQDADDAMNLTMQDVMCVNNKGVSQALSVMYVSGRMVRYVHMSQHLDVAKTITRHLDSLDAWARRAKRPTMRVPALPVTPSAPIVVTAPLQDEGEEEEEEEEEEG